MNKVSYSLRNYKKELILGPLFKVIEVIFELFTPLLMRYMIDEGVKEVENGNYMGVIIPVVLIFCFTVFGFLSTLVCQRFASICSQGFGTDLRERLYKKVNELSLKEIESVGKGNILTLVTNDTQKLQLGIAYIIRLVVRAPVLVIGSLIMCIFISIDSFFVILIGIVVISIIIGIIFFFSSRQILKVQTHVDEMNLKINDDLNGSRVIRAFNKEKDEEERFDKITSNYYKESKKYNILNALVSPFSYLIVNGVIFLIVYFGTNNSFTINGNISRGDLVSLISYLNQILTALLVVFNLVQVFAKAYSSKKRCDKFLSLESSIVSGDIKGDSDIKDQSPLIEFKDVSFRYQDDTNIVIKNINFSINKGETVGIIGGTGSGKSTLIRLLQRFFDRTEGDILFKGNDIKSYDLSFLKQKIAFVSQKVSIYNATIRENLEMGKKYSDDEIKNALIKSDSYEFVSKFDDYLDHKLSESGRDLSGGQKQRLTIARAFLQDSEVIILDDSTSALDFLTDKDIRHNLKELKDKTTIIVSQRASSLRDCSKIIVMYHGEVENVGTHDELLEKSRIYREIYESQVVKR